MSSLGNTDLCVRKIPLSEQAHRRLMASPHSAHHLSPQIVGVSPAARDTPWHRWYSFPVRFKSQLARSVCSFLQMSRWRKVICGEHKSSRRVLLSAFLPRVCGLSQPDSCRRCHLASLLMRMRGVSVSPSYSGLLPARTMCALRWYRGCAKQCAHLLCSAVVALLES